jgi:hypothetical protein
MSNTEITKTELLIFWQRSFDLVKKAYQEGNTGDILFEGWKNGFRHVLEKDFPDKVNSFNTIAKLYIFDFKENESAFDNFMRTRGNSYQLFLDALTEEIKAGK